MNTNVYGEAHAVRHIDAETTETTGSCCWYCINPHFTSTVNNTNEIF